MIPCADVYAALLSAHGAQRWWPGDGPFEIMAGALLVQRTTWRSADIAIGRLKGRDLLEPESLSAADSADVETCIRGAGFFRTKAARLGKLARFVVDHGGLAQLEAKPTRELRALLLALDGVGPETADAILLYAFNRPAVVVDAYLRRLAQRLTAAEPAPADPDLRDWVETAIDDPIHLNEFHALVVVHGQRTCRPEPRCGSCEIRTLCRTGTAASAG